MLCQTQFLTTTPPSTTIKPLVLFSLSKRKASSNFVRFSILLCTSGPINCQTLELEVASHNPLQLPPFCLHIKCQTLEYSGSLAGKERSSGVQDLERERKEGANGRPGLTDSHPRLKETLGQNPRDQNRTGFRKESGSSSTRGQRRSFPSCRDNPQLSAGIAIPLASGVSQFICLWHSSVCSLLSASD